MALARLSLLGKARQRPDQLRRVLEKLQTEGIGPTVRQVRARLDRPIALGYSSAGTVIEVGREVEGFRVGDRVACAAPHAEVVAVGANLVARIPESVAFADACYGVIGAIGLHALRLGHAGLGERVAVIGLGLVGQLVVGLAKVAGSFVMGCDPQDHRLDPARRMGADVVTPPGELEAVVESATGGVGADVVAIAASTASEGLLELAGQIARPKGRIIVVGQFPMTVPRRLYYHKELRLVVSRSSGPGRYDPDYEDQGRDYPIEHVRWTVRRNLEAVLAQIGNGHLAVSTLTTHSVPVRDADRAYALLESRSQRTLGIVLTYPESSTTSIAPRRHVCLRAGGAEPPAEDSVKGVIASWCSAWRRRGRSAGVGVSVIGAGSFAADTWLPILSRADGVCLRGLCSAGGINAAVLGRKHGFAFATSHCDDVWNDRGTAIVVIAVRHDLHVPLGLAGLRAGKHVLLEKPLAISTSQLIDWKRGIAELGDACPVWTVGFNRRFSPASRALREAFAGVVEPRLLSIRMNVGRLPANHWALDPVVGGGRIVGEACHAVDLATWLTDSVPVRVCAEGAETPGGLQEDQAILTLRHANGSVSTIVFASGGARRAGKERVEIFGGGSTGFLDDFCRLTVYRKKSRSLRRRWWSQQKGFAEEWAAFLTAIAQQTPPIPYDEVFAVTQASLAAVEALRRQSPQAVENPAFAASIFDRQGPHDYRADDRSEGCGLGSGNGLLGEQGCLTELSRR